MIKESSSTLSMSIPPTMEYFVLSLKVEVLATGYMEVVEWSFLKLMG